MTERRSRAPACTARREALCKRPISLIAPMSNSLNAKNATYLCGSRELRQTSRITTNARLNARHAMRWLSRSSNTNRLKNLRCSTPWCCCSLDLFLLSELREIFAAWLPSLSCSAKGRGQASGDQPGPDNRAASWGFYSPEAFSVSGLRSAFVIVGFSVLQMT